MPPTRTAAATDPTRLPIDRPLTEAEGPAPDEVLAGQAAYTPRMLATYDLMVHRVTAPWIFGCPTRHLDRHYRRHVSADHLDVGVGTGFLLDRCRFPSPAPRLALMDLNPATLAHSARRLSRYQPESYRHNVLEPFDADVRPFSSVGINYLLHCVPGAIEAKAVAFDHLKALMQPSAVLFGATVLQGGVRRRWPARALMAVFNRHRIFSNRHDDLAGLERALRRRFAAVSIEVIGCVALFAARD